MKKLINQSVITFLLSTIASSTAFAFYDPYEYLYEGSPYTTVQMGVTDKPYFNFEGKKFTGRLATGYAWNASNRLKYGLEGGINIYENAHFYTATTANPRSFSSGTLKKVGLDALAVLDFYVTTRMDIFAKAGPAFMFEKFNYNSSLGQPAKSHIDRGVIKYAYGMGYDISTKTNISIIREMQTRRKNQDLTNSVVPVTSTSIGIKYKFC